MDLKKIISKTLELNILKQETKNIEQTLSKYKNQIESLFHFGEFSRIYQSFKDFNQCLNQIHKVHKLYLNFV